MEFSQNFLYVHASLFTINSSLFTSGGFLLLLFLLGLSLQRRLVALVQTIDDIVGDVEALSGIEDVVTLLGEDEVILLILIICCQEVLQ